ncbi:MAG: Lrp/AsnC family transcriptional regulator, partial [Thermohalobaculum sp.]|nr:Lrp/AsnC family transcriptional regulator [Thermohalobaculum sp.]
NALQEGFPLSPRPFAEAGRALGIAEDDLIARLARLREAGAITRFGPFFDAAAMGGAFCLCAMAVPADRFDAVMTEVNAHPEVAHNYERAHRLNMWFVLATETPAGIAGTARAIEAATGLRVHLFPKIEEFFIGFRVAA